MSEINSINQAHQVLATQQIRIATEQMKAETEEQLKEQYKGTLIDTKA